MPNKKFWTNDGRAEGFDFDRMSDWADIIDSTLTEYNARLDKLDEKLQLMIDVMKEFNAVIDSLNRSITPMMCDIDVLKKKVGNTDE